MLYDSNRLIRPYRNVPSTASAQMSANYARFIGGLRLTEWIVPLILRALQFPKKTLFLTCDSMSSDRIRARDKHVIQLYDVSILNRRWEQGVALCRSLRGEPGLGR